VATSWSTSVAVPHSGPPPGRGGGWCFSSSGPIHLGMDVAKDAIPRSGCRPLRRRRCGICVGRARIWWPTDCALGSGSRRSYRVGGRLYRDGRAWIERHQRWLSSQRFDDMALPLTWAHYLVVVDSRDAELAAMEADLLGWQDGSCSPVRCIGRAAYRGIAELGALTSAAKVIDWRQFTTAPLFMGFTGAGAQRVIHRRDGPHGHITKTGNQVRPHRARGGRARLPAPSRHRRRRQGAPAAGRCGHRRPLVDRAAPAAAGTGG
jgi:hypothetical protein